MAKAISEFVLAKVEWGQESDYFIYKLLENAVRQMIEKAESVEHEPEA